MKLWSEGYKCTHKKGIFCRTESVATVVVLAVVFPSAPVVTMESCVEILAPICMKRRPEDTTIFRGTFNNYIVQVCLQIHEIESRIYQYENLHCRIVTDYGHFGLRSAD